MSMRSPYWQSAATLLGCFLWVSSSAMAAGTAGDRPMTPAYLSQMPVPARILAGVKGQNPEDTLERQMGAFQALVKIVDDMAWTLERRFPPVRATPDETLVRNVYLTAYADLQRKATNANDHRYDHDRDLLTELLAKYFPAPFLDLYFTGNPSGRKVFDAAREGRNIEVTGMGPGATGLTPAAAQAAAAGTQGTAATAATNDPEKLCAAKGLDQFTCMVQSMMGGLAKAVQSSQGPAVPGLRMNGVYQAGNFKLILDQAFNAWVNCGDVFLMSRYDVVRQNNQLLLHLENGANPFALSLGADGTTLAGPASVPIHGRAPGGATTVSTPGSSQQVTTTRQRELTPLEAQQHPDAVQNGQTYSINETSTSTQYTPGTTSAVPVYSPRNAVCKIGVLPVQPAKPVETQAKPDGIVGYLAGMIPDGPFVPNGLRMAGTYDGQGGASIEFLADKAIVSCRATQVEHPYLVNAKAGQLQIQFSGAGGPASLVLATDSSLRGEGSPVQINGHKKTGENAIGDPTYSASADTCSYATLTPRATKQ
jgi:hypothetical protein